MKKIIPLIFSVLYVLNSNAQAVGGWGTCEFADVATMNAFDPSTNAYDCKKVFVQATNNHYYWNGTIWVLVTDTDDQNASEVPFTPVGSIVATDVQAAITEIEPDIYGSIDVHSDVDISTTTPSNGDILEWDGSNFVPTSTDNGYTIFNIFAEESAPLGSGQTEWAFGNGDNTPNGHGIVIPIDCELFAMSIDHEGGANTTVRIIKNTDATLATYQVSTIGAENGYTTFATPLAFVAGDLANFNTIVASSNGTSGRVSAWFRVRSTPASTSLVNDLLDVSAGSIASGDVLYFNGSSFVPLTLEAGNIPYDNSTSSLIATDIQAAIDEIAAGSSSSNIYNTNGTIDANREVALGNFDIEFNSTGTGDFFVSDNGTIVFAVEDDNVGIGIDSPTKPLHIFETTGTPASATNGTIFLEKGNVGGSQSIVFESNINAGNDYGYIEYSDDGSGNGSTLENSLLVIGTENDAAGIYQDDIAIMPSGSLGVGTVSPAAKLDVDGGSVRFSDYGSGTYDDASAPRILGVQSDGDIVEVDPSTLGGGGSSTSAHGTIYIATGDEDETNLSVNVPTKADGETTLINAADVDMPTDNRLRYTGSSTQTFFVSCNISVQVDNNNRQIYYSIRKNGVDVPSINSAKHNSNSNASNELNSTTITGTIELSTNDYIELWIENVESSHDVTVWFMNFSLISIGGGGSGGGGGSNNNIYTADGILGANRTVGLNGNNLTFDATADMIIQGDGSVGIGTTSPDALLDVEGGNVKFSDYGTGSISGIVTQILGVDIDGDIIEVDPSSLGGGGGIGGSNIYNSNGTLNANRTVTLNGNDLTFDTPTDDMIIKGNGSVGIGTTSPDALLDVEGGQVRFSDYGETPGNYEDTTAVYLLGVDPNGDVMEMNTAKNSRIFYPPAIAIVADVIGNDLTLDLHQTYVDLFAGGGTSFIKSTSAPGAIPTYEQDELYYYILNYDTTVFDNVTIDNNGVMEYDVIAPASGDCSFINIVFVVKEP